MLCEIIGHRLRPTLRIDAVGDFYEVDEAVFCSRCGEVNPQQPLLVRALSALP